METIIDFLLVGVYLSVVNIISLFVFLACVVLFVYARFSDKFKAVKPLLSLMGAFSSSATSDDAPSDSISGLFSMPGNLREPILPFGLQDGQDGQDSQEE
jgi:hypothetical protein